MINIETPTPSMVTVVLIIILSSKDWIMLVSKKNKRVKSTINPEVNELVIDGKIDGQGMLKARIGAKE